MSTTLSYEQACADHSWDVPERYNIAADVCDKHPRAKTAMIHEDPEGNVRTVDWGELQDLANRFANVLVAHGVGRGDRVAMLLPPTPETAAAFLRDLEGGGDPAVDVGPVRRRRDPPPLTDSQPKVLVTNAANADRIEREQVEQLLILDDGLFSQGGTMFETADTAAEDPAQLYYS